MRSDKTESEFRKLLAERLGLVNWRPGTSNVIDHTVICAKESGLEFSEEPFRLPEQIRITPNGAYITYDNGYDEPEFLAIIDSSGTWDSTFASTARLRRVWPEIVARYGAYPKLRAECEELVEKVQSFIGKVPVVLTEKLVPIREAVADLENELAKGPKS